MSGVSRHTTRDRLARKTAAPDANGCTVFTGHVRASGYATLWDGEHGKKRLVHRIAYELYVGPIPDGYQVDHLCFVRHCVNPSHLEAVTALENTRRAARGNATKTHCDHGHAFTPANTRIVKRPDGSQCRACRECDAARAQSYRDQRPATIRQRQRAYLAENRDRINAARRARHAEKKAA